jgi:Uma2 family endonuclease
MSQPAVSLDDIGYQDLRIVNGSDRFCVPDIVFIHPGATTAEEERTGIAVVVQVTSPTSPDTVLNDRTTKPVQYAKAGVPLYLLVDQELGRWRLFGLAEGWQRNQVAAVRCTSASRATARRYRRAMVGSMPPSSMHSISSTVMSARPASSATLRPRARR